MNIWYESNSAKKYSWTGSFFAGTGGIFKRKSYEYSLSGKARFNKKFSIDYMIDVNNIHDQPGFAYDTAGIIIFSRRDVKSVENTFYLKYSFTNKMGLTLRLRHFWSKVDPRQFYELDNYGDLKTPTIPTTRNVDQNYNSLTVDLVYNWQFAQGSFISIVWKDIADVSQRGGEFENRYLKNLDNTISGPQYNSLSLKVIYFLDYLNVRNKLRSKKNA